MLFFGQNKKSGNQKKPKSNRHTTRTKYAYFSAYLCHPRHGFKQDSSRTY